MSDLDIIVLHYRESEDICKPLFDSLAMQLCVDLSQVQILLIEDDGIPLNPAFIGRYPTLNIRQVLRNKNGGISEARNTGILHATADYIMFCDCDDMFYSAFGLYAIFHEMEEQSFDCLAFTFIEEGRDAQGTPVLIPHPNDKTFMHGKIYNRRSIVNGDYSFDPAIKYHEDGCFNAVFLNAEPTVIFKDKPFYLWKWRDGSTVRYDSFVLRTYDTLGLARERICRELIARGNKLQACYYAAMFLFDGYYAYSVPHYNTEENKPYLEKAMKVVWEFYKAHKGLIDLLTPSDLSAISCGARKSAVNSGLAMEYITFPDWLALLERAFT